MPYTTPTYAEFITRFPSFGNTTNWPQSIVELILAEAANNIDNSWREADYQLAIMYMTAHLLATDNSANAGVKAHATLSMPTNPTNNKTVTIGAKVYTFESTLTNVDGHVHIGADANASLLNLMYALNQPANGGTSGVDYAAATTPHEDVEKTNAPTGTDLVVRAKIPGDAGNSITVGTNVTGASWDSPNLLGGADGPEVVTGGETFIQSESFAGMSVSYGKVEQTGLSKSDAWGSTIYGRRYLVLLAKNKPAIVVC